MKSRKEINFHIDSLEIEKIHLAEEGKRLDILKSNYIKQAKLEDRPLTHYELEELGERSIEFRKNINRITHELSALNLAAKLLDFPKLLTFDRVIVGGGIGATMLYNELPTQYRNKTRPDNLPIVLVLNDTNNPHTWPKEGMRLMGQPALIQTPPTLQARSESFSLHHNSVNPYNYVVADHFANAVLEAQNDMQMPLVNFKAVAIQTFGETLVDDEPWRDIHYQHRILIECLLGKRPLYVYAHHIDLCTGLGLPNQLSEAQVPNYIARKLKENKKLLYAQDGDIVLKGKVLFYGGSAINAAWIGEIVAGHSSQKAEYTAWVTPRPESFQRAQGLNRLIAAAMTDYHDRLLLGTLEKVTELPSGKLKVTFANFKSYETDEKPRQTHMICDQLVVSIGQELNPLYKHFKHFVPEYCYSLPVGTSSSDKSIITWGAAGSAGVGLVGADYDKFVADVGKHARSFPHESQALAGIYRSYWTIKHLAHALQEKGRFPFDPYYKPHNFLYDINLASLEELKQIIGNGGFYNDSESYDYAKKIIQVRSMQRPIGTTDLPGINSLQDLVDHLPQQVLQIVQAAYFPYESLAVLESVDSSMVKVSSISLFQEPDTKATQAINTLPILKRKQ